MHYQRFHLRRDSRTAAICPAGWAIELGGYESLNPAQDGVRLGHLGDVLHGLAFNTFGDLCQQVFIPPQQFREQARPAQSVTHAKRL